MRALLDVNVLIALLDPDHVQHQTARAWLVDNADAGWASCPITENGCVRIMALPGYSNPLPASAVVERLRTATRTPYHSFWADDVSLLDAAVADSSRIMGPSQVTDTYLLALAVAHDGRLVTFDKRIAIESVHGATPAELTVL